MKKAVVFMLCAALILCLAACAGSREDLLSKSKPVAITVWNYYNGAQKQAFDELVQLFNETVGAEKGIVVESSSQGNVEDLKRKVLDAADKKVGAESLPDIFGAYSDTAFELKSRGLLCDITGYLTEQELLEFVPSYLYEGGSRPGEVLMFPVAKSTEVLAVNHTAWLEFQAATGASEDGFNTWEGITGLAKQYYEWSDSLTPETDDGQAFFGRDSMGNYMLVGAYQLGAEMLVVKDGEGSIAVDDAAMRRLWDNYYVPYIKGYFAAVGHFRSDDIKTGDIISLVCSTSGALYLPSDVTGRDGVSHPIEVRIYELPGFEGTKPVAVQQGAGMAIAKSTEQREYASSIFLKWFTDPEQNLRFSINSGYMPVKTEASDNARVSEAMEDFDPPVPQIVRDTLSVGIGMTKSYELYASKAFKQGIAAREILTNSMQARADADLAAINDLVAGGMSRADAIARYNNGGSFDDWLQSLKSQLSSLG